MDQLAALEAFDERADVRKKELAGAVRRLPGRIVVEEVGVKLSVPRRRDGGGDDGGGGGVGGRCCGTVC